MPLYEYKCTECKKVFEILQRMNEEPLTECLSCGGKVEKLISPTAFQFKGTGWYVTDYKKDSTKSGNSDINFKDKDSSPIKNSETNKNATINK